MGHVFHTLRKLQHVANSNAFARSNFAHHTEPGSYQDCQGTHMHTLDSTQDCTFYHGSADPLPDTVLAGDETRWWNAMDHSQFLDPPWNAEDGADNGELAAELRTVYANIVYEAFRSAENPDLHMMAENFGLSGLGSQVGIIFIADDLKYVERYGQAHEIDMEADGILDILFDENASRPSWLVVMRAGVPFPLKEISPTVQISAKP